LSHLYFHSIHALQFAWSFWIPLLLRSQEAKFIPSKEHHWLVLCGKKNNTLSNQCVLARKFWIIQLLIWFIYVQLQCKLENHKKADIILSEFLVSWPQEFITMFFWVQIHSQGSLNRSHAKRGDFNCFWRYKHAISSFY